MNKSTLVRKVLSLSHYQKTRGGKTERCEALPLLCADRIKKVNEKNFSVESARPTNKIAALAQ